MNIYDVWSLFKMTGKIEYFLKYKELQEKGMITLGNNESKRNSNK